MSELFPVEPGGALASAYHLNLTEQAGDFPLEDWLPSLDAGAALGDAFAALQRSSAGRRFGVRFVLFGEPSARVVASHVEPRRTRKRSPKLAPSPTPSVSRADFVAAVTRRVLPEGAGLEASTFERFCDAAAGWGRLYATLYLPQRLPTAATAAFHRRCVHCDGQLSARTFALDAGYARLVWFGARPVAPGQRGRAAESSCWACHRPTPTSSSSTMARSRPPRLFKYWFRVASRSPQFAA